MKKIILSAILLISFLVFPFVSQASYIIYLKNGGKFITAQYREENGQIIFFVRGGTMGIDKAEVKKIEKSNLDPDENNEIDEPINNIPPVIVSTPEKTIKKDAIPPESAPKEAKVDLEAYKSKMKGLRDNLDTSLEKIKEASKNHDKTAAEKAREEMRKIADDIYALTEELKKKNKGELPENWWLNQ